MFMVDDRNACNTEANSHLLSCVESVLGLAMG
jgi:hypothetical protein